MHRSKTKPLFIRLARATVAVAAAAAVGYIVSHLSPELRYPPQPESFASGADVMTPTSVGSVPAGISEIETEAILAASQSTLRFVESLGTDTAELELELAALIERSGGQGLIDRVALQSEVGAGLLDQASAAYRWMAQSRPWHSL